MVKEASKLSFSLSLSCSPPPFFPSLSLFLGMLPRSANIVRVFVCIRYFTLSLPPLFFRLSLERARASVPSDQPAEVESCDKSSYVERQTATCPAGLVDDVLMVILNFPGLSIPLGGLVYRLLPRTMCGLDKRAFYKGAYSLLNK